MKSILYLLLLFLFGQPAFPQGMTTFRATLLPISSAPPGTPTGNAQFHILEGNIVDGIAGFGAESVYLSFARFENRAGEMIVESTGLSVDCAVETDQCVVNSLWVGPVLDQAQIDQMIRGETFVTLAMADNPEAIIRGQLQLIPEPATWTIFVVGFSLWLSTRRKSPTR